LHTVTSNDDFGFVNKDFVKAPAEGSQFIKGKSLYPKTTFKSTSFGKAIRLRRLKQRKQGYLRS